MKQLESTRDRVRRRVGDALSSSTILGGRAAPARSLAYLDGRRAVRLAFLAGAATHGYLALLPDSRAGLAASCEASRADRLDAWLQVGIALGELGEIDGTVVVTGTRAKAIARNDHVVTPFYRSIGEYYFGPHTELDQLLGDHPGRSDLSRSAQTIADVSKVTEPVLAGILGDVVDAVRPLTWLEIGCGSGVHLASAIAKRPTLRAVAVDLDSDVVADAQLQLARAGAGDRVSFRVGDVRDVVTTDEAFDVVTLLNNIYYFDASERRDLIERVAGLVVDGGELVVASQCAAQIGDRGSVAAAQLDLMLRVQREAPASLPTIDGLVELVASARGVESVDIRRPVPTEPYVVVRGRVSRP